MKFIVRKGLSAKALRASVPTSYRSLLPNPLSDGPHTLLRFRNDNGEAILSRTVGSALAKAADPSEALVAVGGCFTAEGLELLQARQAVILRLNDFHWTDESYTNVYDHL